MSYGLTETGSAVAYDGRPLAGVEVRVDGGGPAEATAGGEILIRGPMLLRAYRGDTPEGRDPRDGDGWFATGDQGSLDATGRLVVHGRRGDLIITGGQNVWPLPVERALATHPDIADLAGMGTPDPNWGEVVTGDVVPTDRTRPPSLDALRDHGRGGLAPYALPRTLVLCDSLPRTTLGKLDRTRLPRP